jgi:AcrR family transcriptional regulator
MGTTERRERHRASLRREILDAASRLFVEEGHDAVTMRRIAERIEYSATTLYLHFKDKNELLEAVCEETFSQLAARLERLEKSANSPLSYLREALRAYVEFGLAHPALYSVTFTLSGQASKAAPIQPASDRGSAGPPGSRARSAAPAPGNSTAGRAFEALREGVRLCAESRDIHTPNIDMTAQALWAAVHGVTSLLISMKGFPFASRAALVDHTVDTLVAGLRIPMAPPRAPVQAQSKKWDFMD